MKTTKEPVEDPRVKYCANLDDWAAKMIEREAANGADRSFEESWREVRRGIRKSCLLSRTVYGGENPSQTPCPVHKGQWLGIQIGWPGSRWYDPETKTYILAEVSSTCQEWYDQGCRCAMHTGCSCTTGWQPDEHCGCGVRP